MARFEEGEMEAWRELRITKHILGILDDVIDRTRSIISDRGCAKETIEKTGVTYLVMCAQLQAVEEIRRLFYGE